MTSTLSRREFLKLSGLVAASAALPTYFLKPGTSGNDPNQGNILIIVFDAWSAANTSLYGYGRETMPNLERLANKAVVYHNHYSGGNFTTPGTASLLTGALPWSHRAMVLNDTVHKSYAQKSIFHVFEGYQRIAYTHNPIANTLLRQFMGAMDQYLPMHTHYLERDFLLDTLFSGDRDIATVSVSRALKQVKTGNAYSLYLSRIYEKYKLNLEAKRVGIEPDFPRGVPNYDGISYFTLEQGIDGVLDMVGGTDQPFLGYYHFLPPHNPYKTRMDFYNQYVGDGFTPPDKPNHFFAKDPKGEQFDKKRRLYDEFILYIDYEFARLYEGLAASGLLDNTWLVLTSDHGEMFERGILGHMTPSLHQPVIHTPLVIFPPGVQNSVDVYDPTSAIDLLPTLANISGLEVPTWAEGRILPPFGTSNPASDLDVFGLQLGDTGDNNRIASGTVMLVRDRYKLTWYFGYTELGEGEELVELYDLAADPQELENIATKQQELTDELLAAAKAKLANKDQAT